MRDWHVLKVTSASMNQSIHKQKIIATTFDRVLCSSHNFTRLPSYACLIEYEKFINWMIFKESFNEVRDIEMRYKSG